MPRAQAGDQCSPIEYSHHRLELERESLGCLRKRRSELSVRAKYPWQEAPTRKKVLSSTRLSFSTNLDAALPRSAVAADNSTAIRMSAPQFGEIFLSHDSSR